MRWSRVPIAARRRASQLAAITTDRDGRLLTATVILILTVVVQRPLFQIEGGKAVLLVRPWDVAWVLVVAISVPIVADLLRHPSRLPSIVSPLGLFAAFGLLCVVSIGWEYLTFGSLGLLSAAIRALRLAAIPYLALALYAVWDARVARVLVAAIVVAGVAGAVLATYAWAFVRSPETGVGVTRPGGPFGNYFADGSADRWWAWPAASATLGLWLAVCLLLVLGLSVRLRENGRRPPRSLSVGLVLLLGGLGAALLATHSRESWVAAVAGAAVLLAILSRHAPRRFGAIAIVGLVLGAVFVVAAVPSLRDRIGDTFRSGSFAYETGPAARLDAWERALAIGFDRLPMGWGVGAVEEHPNLFGLETAENLYLQTFMQTGLIGTALLLASLCTCLAQATTRLLSPKIETTPLLAASIFLVLVFHGLFGNSIGDPSVQVITGCGLAAAASLRFPMRDGSRLSDARSSAGSGPRKAVAKHQDQNAEVRAP